MSLGRERKGRFGRADLPVSAEYVRPRSRARSLWVGLALGVAGIGAYFGSLALDRDELVSGGPVSSNHAFFENDCMACHSPLQGVSDAKCEYCHEKIGTDLGAYSFDQHYLYAFTDLSRIDEGRDRCGADEMRCVACHTEHGGRNAAITTVPDDRCTVCHAYGSFNRDHPEFEFVRDSIPDDDGLLMTHIRHTKAVLTALGTAQVVRACLECHQPTDDGRGFRPIDFDAHCRSCHPMADKQTSLAPIWSGSAPGTPGVRTLSAIRDSREPGTVWSNLMSDAAFSELPGGAGVIKRSLEHRDPWILDNLRFIRRAISPDAGGDALELVPTSGPASDETDADVYADAIRLLEEQVDALRGRGEEELRPEIQRADSLLASARARIRNPVRLARERMSTEKPAAGTPPLADDPQAWSDLAQTLSSQCQKCHRIEDAVIARVQTDQKVLDRALFDHRAHVLDGSCTDCHYRIQVYPDMPAPEGQLVYGYVDVDSSSCQNLPPIGNCRECHTPREAASDCVTCHHFHVNKTERTNLLLTAE
jgi:hypothetical protein